MSKVAIQVENLSKAYQIGQIGTGTLSRDVDRFWKTKILGKEDPFLKIGETNDRSIKGSSDIVWSLKDINFVVNQGDAVGIIGKNGAGKSTLLKLLSRVTSPTTGQIKVKGRIASLLEVGTGFHPELSGRENIYLNGAILGMRKKEITRKLDEIIDFSGVERYIDTPVKRYSSGMYVRLAFAVAAHLESEILIVDEVLAVGDAEFQKKCLGKMGDISRGEGRTVLFVSHNMTAVKSLCTKGILLENGLIASNNFIENVIDKYLTINSSENESGLLVFDKDKEVYVKKIEIEEQFNGNHKTTAFLRMGSVLKINYEVSSTRKVTNFKTSLLIKNSFNAVVCAIRTHEMLNQTISFNQNLNISLTIDDLLLMPGEYSITIGIADSFGTIEVVEDCKKFTIVENDIYQTGRIPKGNNIVYSKAKWELNQI